MKVLVLLLCSVSCFAQYSAKYDRDRLVGLSGLTEPVNCGLMKFSGPVQEVRTVENYVYFTISRHDVELDASKLSNVDRSNLFTSMLRKGRHIKVSGYACGSNGLVDPVSLALHPR
jgi:hypothetical protein